MGRGWSDGKRARAVAEDLDRRFGSVIEGLGYQRRGLISWQESEVFVTISNKILFFQKINSNLLQFRNYYDKITLSLKEELI